MAEYRHNAYLAAAGAMAAAGIAWLFAHPAGVAEVIGAICLIVLAAITLVGVFLAKLPGLREAQQSERSLTQLAASTNTLTTAKRNPLAHQAGPLRAKTTNDSPFPCIESARDSLGNVVEVEEDLEDFKIVETNQVLRPGQEVSFNLEASDPNGENMLLSVEAPAGGDADVTISDGVVRWKVRDEDIADPAYVYIYVTSRRNYHKHVGIYDDKVLFIYRILPRA